MTDRPDPNPTLKSVLELGPLLAFFAGYLLLRDHTISLGGRDYEGFVIVTALFVPLIAVTNWLLYRLTGAVSKMQILTLVLVVVLGGLTVFLNDERFFKMKSTFAFSTFGAILGIGLLRGQSWLEYILDSAIPISHVGWMALTRRLMVFFFLVAAANEVIWRNFSTDVFVAWDTFGQMGAMALFGEKYSDLVRVVDIEGASSVALCGGTHVANTSEIGLFRITSESSVSAGVRRIDAVTGQDAYRSFQQDRDTLKHVATALKAEPSQALERAASLREERSELERQVRQLQQRLANLEAKSLGDEAPEIDGVRVLAKTIDVASRDELLAYADSLRQRIGQGEGILLLGSAIEGKAALLCMITETAQKARKVRAGDLINEVATHVGGRGGGRPTLAQAGGSNPAGIPAAVAAFEDVVRKALGHD